MMNRHPSGLTGWTEGMRSTPRIIATFGRPSRMFASLLTSTTTRPRHAFTFFAVRTLDPEKLPYAGASQHVGWAFRAGVDRAMQLRDGEAVSRRGFTHLDVQARAGTQSFDQAILLKPRQPHSFAATVRIGCQSVSRAISWVGVSEQTLRNWKKFAGIWSRRSDLNRGPADYESAALPTELRRLEGV